MADLTSPLADAIGYFIDAGKAWLDGPGKHAREVAARLEQPGYTTDQAANDAAACFASWARASAATGLAAVNATALMAKPPEPYVEGDLYTIGEHSGDTLTVTFDPIKDVTWIFPAVEPASYTISVRPSPVLPPGENDFVLRVTPATGIVIVQVTITILDKDENPVGSTIPYPISG